jgi:NADH-quinone oxidoreductase subunit G
MIKQGGEWKAVDWQTALEYVANGLKQIKTNHGADRIGALLSPHSTLEEMALTKTLIQGLGSESVDFRLRHAEFSSTQKVPYLGTSIASLTTLQRVLVVGSNLRKDHPLFAQRIRQATKAGAQVHAIVDSHADWALPLSTSQVVESAMWVQTLADIAVALAEMNGVAAPAAGTPTEAAKSVAKSLSTGERKAILLGNAAAHHAKSSSLVAIASWLAAQTGSSIGYLTEAANTVGGYAVGALPTGDGFHAGQMLTGALKAAILVNVEPEFDTAVGSASKQGLMGAEMVVTLSPFKCNLSFSDVLLPIAPFTETSGSFVNAEGRVQSFHAVVKPLGETRPAWKVLRVLGNLMSVQGMEFDSSQEVLASLESVGIQAGSVAADRLGLSVSGAIDLTPAEVRPVVASIYQLDGLVRRSSSLQLTADARAAHEVAA